MNAETLYLVCFCVGLVLCVVSFAGGMGHLHVGGLHGGHFHLGNAHVAHIGHHGPAVSFFNGFTITAFLCWFGGVGFLLTRHHTLAALLVMLAASLAGLLGAAVIFLFLAKVLLPHERALLPEHTEMRGVVARVTGALEPNRMGEILFTLNGTRRSAAARSEDGEPIAKQSQVLVIGYARGVATVRRCTELDDLPSAPASARLR